ncbi:hypothetical protein F4774DRAFT_342144 [Daldinia eschscholtzii]|nr:hypothetical protein F4774DRAFT_342144 [Daldinia eschscholtzii]
MKANFLATLILAQGIAGHAIPRHSSCKPAAPATGKAVYFLSNDAENTIVALPIQPDGTLKAGKRNPVNGVGSNVIDGTTKEPAAPDALVSQSSLVISGKTVFAVNAQSGSVTAMTISDDDPTNLLFRSGGASYIQKPFPNTVAASAKNNVLCVATTATQAGVSCAGFRDGNIDPFRSVLSFDLGQSNPPVGPTNTVSQVLFSDDESMLITIVKGDPMANKTGFISTLPVSEIDSECPHDTRTSPEGTAVLFGSQIIPGTSTLFATDASFGAAVLDIDAATGGASVVGKQALDDQKATCWSAYSETTKSVFVTDVAVPRIVEMSAKDASIISQIDLSHTGDAGFIDLAAAGNFLYVLSPGTEATGAAVIVLDISGGQGKAKFLQRFNVEGLAGKNAQGMAILQ